MTGENGLLTALEKFVDRAVDTSGFAYMGDPLQTKLDVLERVVELLRLRTGWHTERLRTRELLDAGVTITEDWSGRTTMKVGHGDPRVMWDWPIVYERKEIELQAALLIYLLHFHRPGTRIGKLLVEFANLLRDQLSPADAETTETGVTRIMTTIRSAARSLRTYGLLTDSTRVAYRTWELSIFGVLVAVRLHERGETLALPPRRPRRHSPGSTGSRNILVHGVLEVVRELSDPVIAGETLMRACGSDVDVFESFRPAVEVVQSYSEHLVRSGYDRRRPAAALRKDADAMLKMVAEIVPPSALADDLAKHFAIKELIV